MRPCIDQFIEGLGTMNFYGNVLAYPEYFVEVMTSNNSTILNVVSFESMFEIMFSEVGSNRRRTENKIVSYWKDFLVDSYGKFL